MMELHHHGGGKEAKGVADQLFTISHRTHKLAGRPKLKNPYDNTGSCFDITTPSKVRASSHDRIEVPEEDLPQYNPAQCCYTLKPGKPAPGQFLRKGQGEEARASRARRSGSASPPAQELERQPRPPRAGATHPRANPPNTLFRRHYERSDLPICLDHQGSKTVLRWKISPESLDYHHYLPIFFDGIRETLDPQRFMAVKGCEDMLKVGGPRILPVIPQLVMPLKTALNTRNEQVVCITLRLLQLLVTSVEQAGEALVPYYRQLLPMLNLYRRKNKNLGDEIDYSQQEYNCVGELVADTLALLELHGGPDAYINIKYLVPTYESCLHATSAAPAK